MNKLLSEIPNEEEFDDGKTRTIEEVRTDLSTGWSGIEAYFEQCKKSEEL